MSEDGQVISSQDLSAKLHAARGHIRQLPHFGKFLYAVGGRVNGTFNSTGAIDRITVESAEE